MDELKIVTRELRLEYYNNYLYKHGVITEREHRKMQIAIWQRIRNLRAKEKTNNKKL